MSTTTNEGSSEKKFNLDTKSALAFFDKNQKIILGVVGAIVLLTIGYYVYKNFFQAPKNDQAAGQMWEAQKMFEKDSFQLALNNPGVGQSGFLKIINNYGSTPTGNLAKYYAGICYLNMGDWDKAIKYLEDYDEAGDLTPAMKYAALGDAYAEKKNDSKALSSYEKAASLSKNEIVFGYSHRKLGMYYEKMNKYADAASTYQKIVDEYPSSQEGQMILNYLERAKSKATAKK